LEDRLDKKGSLLYHIDAGLKFIYNAYEEGGKILVHCMEGKSRSTSIVIAYLMDSQGLSLLKSYQHVKCLRFITQPNQNFLDQLAEYEKNVWFSKYGEESSSLEETKTWLNSNSTNSHCNWE
jgi:protein-tyrosine phosphatase